MKILNVLPAALLLLSSGFVLAQDKDAKPDNKRHTISLSNEGLSVKKTDSTGKVADTTDKRWSSFMAMDLGVNFLQDNTNYNDAGVKSYLNVPASKQNADLFALNRNKSINVNLYWLKSLRVLKTKGQRIYISSGLGLQLYNFRFKENITFTKNPSSIIMDTLAFSKNKIGMDYLNVPLMITFKTRFYQNKANHKKDKWLVYGAGITAGYSLSTWSKQISGEKGKIKVHDDFSFNPFNACLTAEIGVDGWLKFYGSYQLTNMYTNNMDQRPICIGIKLSGI
jgi:hypothetical protein